MTLPTRVGISLPIPPDVDACMARALWAEQEGFDNIWFADLGSVDSLTLAAAVGVKTERVRLGMGVVPVYTRTPALFASTAMTLSHLAPGRLVMGIGASSHLMIEGWHGMAFEKPLTRVKEVAQAMRAMLQGSKEPFEGETVRSRGFRLHPPPKGPVPIYLAALRPKMLEMAGEFGDGVVLNMYPVEALPRMLEHVAKGAARAGKKLEDLEIVCRHHVIVTDDEDAAREEFRRRFAPYFATPVYNRFLAWCGYPQVASTIEEGWREKDRGKTTNALDDDLVDKIGVIGSPDKCRALLREHVAAGINTVIINPISENVGTIAATFEAFTPRNFSV